MSIDMIVYHEEYHEMCDRDEMRGQQELDCLRRCHTYQGLPLQTKQGDKLDKGSQSKQYEDKTIQMTRKVKASNMSGGQVCWKGSPDAGRTWPRYWRKEMVMRAFCRNDNRDEGGWNVEEEEGGLLLSLFLPPLMSHCQWQCHCLHHHHHLPHHHHFHRCWCRHSDLFVETHLRPNFWIWSFAALI